MCWRLCWSGGGLVLSHVLLCFHVDTPHPEKFRGGTNMVNGILVGWMSPSFPIIKVCVPAATCITSTSSGSSSVQ